MQNMLSMCKKLWLVIGCLSVASAQNPFCSGDFYFIRPDPNSGKSWTDAQQICKNNNSTLPIVDNPNRQRNFVDALTYYGLNGRDVWLGARASYTNSESWSWLDRSRYNGPVVQERGSYYKSYAFVTNRTNKDNSNAYASPPNASYSYICQCNVTDPRFCSNRTGQTDFFKDNQCYMKYEENLPWFSARNKCLETGCDLASISQLSLLDGMLDFSGSWVGLRTSQWNWQNAVTGLSSDVTFTSWRIGQPNDANPTCISTDSGDFPNWRDIDCAKDHSYICQVSDTSSSSVPSTTACTTMTSFRLGTTSTSTNTDENKPRSSIPKTSTTKPKNSTDPATETAALAIGLGVGLGVPFTILIIVVIVVVVVVLRRKHRNSAESRNAQSTKKFVANESEIITDDGTTGTKDKKKKGKDQSDNSPGQYATVRETIPAPDLVPPSTQGTVYADLRFSGEGS